MKVRCRNQGLRSQRGTCATHAQDAKQTNIYQLKQLQQQQQQQGTSTIFCQSPATTPPSCTHPTYLQQARDQATHKSGIRAQTTFWTTARAHSSQQNHFPRSARTLDLRRISFLPSTQATHTHKEKRFRVYGLIAHPF